MTDSDDEIARAIASYTGTVTVCRPGSARGKRVRTQAPERGRPVNVHHDQRHMRDDEVAQWLSERERVVTPEQRREDRRKARADNRRRKQHRKREAVLERIANERRKRT